MLRVADGITEAIGWLAGRDTDSENSPGVDGWETTNLHVISSALAAAALRREETRGSHWREDFPERDDVTQAGHIDTRLVEGRLEQSFVPAPSTDPSTGAVS